MKVHTWLEKTVDAQGLEKIRATVEKTEKRTDAEFVPMIVHHSITLGHVAWIVFLVVLLATWILEPVLVRHVPGVPRLIWDIGTFAVALVVTLVVDKIDGVRRACTPAHDRAVSVERRAMLEFHHQHVDCTKARNGILIFVSLLERRAVVLADQAITDRLPRETWSSVISALLEKTKAGDFAGGMCAAIEMLGDRLQSVLPPSGEKPADQLENRLIIKE